MCVQCLDRQWRRKQVALKLVAALVGQEVALLLRFHALGHHLQVQALGQRNDGA